MIGFHQHIHGDRYSRVTVQGVIPEISYKTMTGRERNAIPVPRNVYIMPVRLIRDGPLFRILIYIPQMTCIIAITGIMMNHRRPGPGG